ncbi:CASP-like protein 4B1 [Beta vulgaris subsp. vulgaris]|uniref:CASP-like protein 4B1 n=1 Tax=Beta vulgaris subsp. vulgaris TaxID=3555 RepID=UPI002036C6B6|nr:CASP-like protein 4B1 [Beta vulgaris subsp. vulgaris]
MQQPPVKQADVRLPRPPGTDVEGGARVTPESYSPGPSDGKIWKGEWMKLWVLIFRACALAFSCLSFILMACVGDFYLYYGLSYLLGIAVIVTVYTAVQVGIKGHELRTKTDVIPRKVAIWIDFCGDQLLAYMLFSSASVGATISVALRSEYTGVGLELVAASVSMSVLAFVSLTPAALFSAYRLFANLSN